MRKWFVAGAVAILVPTVLWWGDVKADRENIAVIEARVPLFKDGPSSGNPVTIARVNPVIAQLEPGQRLPVRRIRYGKDYAAIEVQAGDNSGWVLYGVGVKLDQRQSGLPQ